MTPPSPTAPSPAARDDLLTRPDSDDAHGDDARGTGSEWWRTAVIYQIYPAPSRTRTATASATSPASPSASPRSASSASTRSGSPLLPLPAERRRLRRRRLLRGGPAVRHARRLRPDAAPRARDSASA
ncbi:hypothetical protein WDV94_16355 [Clavibacter tessellarius]